MNRFLRKACTSVISHVCRPTGNFRNHRENAWETRFALFESQLNLLLSQRNFVNGNFSDLAFERIFNLPKRGLGPATLQALYHVSRAQGVPLIRAAAMLADSDELRPKARKTLASLLADFARWRDLEPVMAHPELVMTILEESGYTEMWQLDKSPNAPGRLENLKELIRALDGFENLAGFLEHVSLVAENESRAADDAVNIMTLHGAKGLEYDTVFLPGWEEGLFPHQRALDEGGNRALEEERRLAYVGITRAKRQAHISFAANRLIFNRWQASLPSRFIAELPDAHVEREAATGLFAGGGQGTGLQHGLVSFDDGYAGRREQRMRPAGRTPPPRYIDGQAELVVTSDPEAAKFETGARVFHLKFGYGRVARIDGNKLEVSFDKAGTKKVIDSYVKPA